MAKIPDLSKLNLKGIMDNVKAMIGQTPIPEASKDDPIGYLLSELSKTIKTLAELHAQEADAIAKIDTTLGALYQTLAQNKPATTTPKEPAKSEPSVAKKEE